MGRFTTYGLTFRRDDLVTLEGYDQPLAAIHWSDKNTLVIKVPGHTYWRGIGMARGYAAAEFQVYERVSGTFPERGANGFVRAERVATFPVTRDKGGAR